MRWARAPQAPRNDAQSPRGPAPVLAAGPVSARAAVRTGGVAGSAATPPGRGQEMRMTWQGLRTIGTSAGARGE